MPCTSWAASRLAITRFKKPIKNTRRQTMGEPILSTTPNGDNGNNEVYWPRVKEILDGIMDRWK